MDHCQGHTPLPTAQMYFRMLLFRLDIKIHNFQIPAPSADLQILFLSFSDIPERFLSPEFSDRYHPDYSGHIPYLLLRSDLRYHPLHGCLRLQNNCHRSYRIFSWISFRCVLLYFHHCNDIPSALVSCPRSGTV